MKISLKAYELLENTIANTKQQETEGKVPFFTSGFWEQVRQYPEQNKKMIKELEKQAQQKIK